MIVENKSPQACKYYVSAHCRLPHHYQGFIPGTANPSQPHSSGNRFVGDEWENCDFYVYFSVRGLDDKWEPADKYSRKMTYNEHISLDPNCPADPNKYTIYGT